MKKHNLIISIIFYFLGGIILSYYLYGQISPTFRIHETGTIILLGSSFLLGYLGSLFLTKYKNNNKPIKICFYIFFILYGLVLISITLFNRHYGRLGINFNWNIETWTDSINLIPFKTIIEYIDRNDFISFINIFGNILAFMPMGFFLPILFPKQNTFKTFIFTNTIIILIIETMQLLSESGSFDIDDFILNLTGAIIIFKIVKYDKINKLIKRFIIREKRET